MWFGDRTRPISDIGEKGDVLWWDMKIASVGTQYNLNFQINLIHILTCMFVCDIRILIEILKTQERLIIQMKCFTGSFGLGVPKSTLLVERNWEAAVKGIAIFDAGA